MTTLSDYEVKEVHRINARSHEEFKEAGYDMLGLLTKASGLGIAIDPMYLTTHDGADEDNEGYCEVQVIDYRNDSLSEPIGDILQLRRLIMMNISEASVKDWKAFHKSNNGCYSEESTAANKKRRENLEKEFMEVMIADMVNEVETAKD